MNPCRRFAWLSLWALMLLIAAPAHASQRRARDLGLRVTPAPTTQPARAATPTTPARAISPAPALIYRDPIFIPGSDWILIPVKLIADANAKSAKSSLWPISAPRFADPDPRSFNNVVLVHRQTNQQRLLLDRPAVIVAFYTPLDLAPTATQPADARAPNYLLIGLSERDTNADGQINGDDETIAYLSDPAGNHLTALTPPDCQFTRFKIDPATGKLYVQVRRDSNHDLRFTEADEALWLKVDPDWPVIGTPVLHEAISNRLRQLLGR